MNNFMGQNTMRGNFTENFQNSAGQRMLQSRTGNAFPSKQNMPQQRMPQQRMPLQRADQNMSSNYSTRHSNGMFYKHSNSGIVPAITTVLVWTLMIFAIIALAKYIFSGKAPAQSSTSASA